MSDTSSDAVEACPTVGQDVDFPSRFAGLRDCVDAWVAEEVRGFQSKGKHYEAIAYALGSGGKRLRSVLAIASSQLFPVEQSKLRSVCLALEFLHTASLIHDDLPGLDDDAFRRGKATTHVVHGEGPALLAGDALIALAYERIATDASLASDVRVALLQRFSEAFADLCEGQSMDLDARALEGSESKNVDILKVRHIKKTGALISAAASVGAYLSGAGDSSDELARLSSFGLSLGLLFQITDDILDVTSTREKLGKDVNSDSDRGTPTYVSIFGLDGAKEYAEKTGVTATSYLASFGAEADFLRSFVGQVLRRQH